MNVVKTLDNVFNDPNISASVNLDISSDPKLTIKLLFCILALFIFVVLIVLFEFTFKLLGIIFVPVFFLLTCSNDNCFNSSFSSVNLFNFSLICLFCFNNC